MITPLTHSTTHNNKDMITKTLTILLSLSIALTHRPAPEPMIISIDVEFCDLNNIFVKSICRIQEAEEKSNNQLLVDKNGELRDIIIDKRSLTTEKAKAFFGDGSITIRNESIIKIPYLKNELTIRPGEYPVKTLRRGYRIQIYP